MIWESKMFLHYFHLINLIIKFRRFKYKQATQVHGGWIQYTSAYLFWVSWTYVKTVWFIFHIFRLFSLIRSVVIQHNLVWGVGGVGGWGRGFCQLRCRVVSVGHVCRLAHQLASLLQTLAWLLYLNCNCCSQLTVLLSSCYYSHYCIWFCG